MKIYDLLKEDHTKVKELLNTLTNKYDPKLLDQLVTELTLHNEAEEEAFYEPLQSKAGNLKIIFKEAHEEHDLTMEMMHQLKKLKDDEEGKSRLLSVIKKSLEAHIEKEEDDIFNFAEKHFSAKEAQEMASNMKRAKNRLKEEL